MEQPTKTRRPRIFSGVQPTGNLHLGNYIGALRNFKKLEPDYDCIYSIVDLHAITVRQDPAQLRAACTNLLALYLALGLNPERSLIYFQSHVPAHAELAWIFNCSTYMGELSRMTQYKEKILKHKDNINAGLFAYPTLMASDILLYQTDLVPVGADQKQHLELTRNIAERVNGIYGNLLVVPEPYIGETKDGARVMSLADPTRKMSKSDPLDTIIGILEEPSAIRKKFRRAVTDSEGSIRYDPEGKPGVANLMTIFSAFTGMTMDEITAEYDGKGYGVFKDAVADATIEALAPLKARHTELLADKAYLNEVSKTSAERASQIAERTMLKVRKKIGLAPFEI